MSETVKAPGATLYVETKGKGPVLLLIPGGPTDAGMFTDLAGRLADRYTTVAYDPRGHSRSTLEGEPVDIPVALHADGAAAVVPAMGVFGSAVEEGGPKYSEQMDQAPSTPESQEMMGRMTGNFELFIAHEIQPIGSYQPDIDMLKKVPTRIVSAAGEDSAEQGA